MEEKANVKRRLQRIYRSRSRAFWDIMTILILSVLFYVVAGSSGLLERVDDIFHKYEEKGLHEIVLMTIVVIVLLAFYSRRRVRELKKENERRVTIEKSLLNERKNLQEILESTPYGVILIDKDKTILYANREALRMMGYDHMSGIVGKICHQTLCPAEATMCPILDLGKKLDKSEKILITKDGDSIPILKTVVPVLFDGEEVLLEAFLDISEHKEAEAFIRDILESIDEAFIVIDRDLRIRSANKAYCDQTMKRHEDIVGNACYAVTHGIDRPCFEEGEECPVMKTFRTKEPHVAVHIHKDNEGFERHIEIKAFPLNDASGKTSAAIEIMNDVTEKRILEDQLRHSQKMEAIGTLTSGVAHEFNNILTSILGFSEMMLEEMQEGDPLREYALLITESAGRASRLTEGLLAYSRKQITHMNPLNINEIIHKSERILSNLADENISIIVAHENSEIYAKGDRGQIEQVLMNLATNAFDAMPDGGKLEIRSERREINADLVDIPFTIPAGNYAVISVRDTGTGMDEKTKEKIFEPFFTTKEVGKGTGLGLSMVYGIVRRHSGYLSVESDVGKGTTVNIYLPLIEKEEIDDEVPPSRVPMKGIETILLAEDDANVRNLVMRVLEKSGYKVITAGTGSEVVKMFHDFRENVDLLVLDVVMPMMNGIDAYREIRKVNPGIGVIFMSGYLADDERTKVILDEGHILLRKPVSPKDLLQKIREVLD